MAGVLVVLEGDSPGELGWLHLCQGDHAALRLGYDLLGDHQDVAVLKSGALGLGCIQQHTHQFVAGPDLRHPGYADEEHLRWGHAPPPASIHEVALDANRNSTVYPHMP